MKKSLSRETVSTIEAKALQWTVSEEKMSTRLKPEDFVKELKKKRFLFPLYETFSFFF